MATDLGRKTFTAAEQVRFAQLSGDTNPMHMDATAARRTQMGAPIVHGVNGVLWALDTLCSIEDLPFNGLKINFSGPIYVGDTATIIQGGRSETHARIQVRIDGASATAISLNLGEIDAAAPEPHAHTVKQAEWPATPIELAFDEMAHQSGAIAFARPAAEVAEAYPALTQRLSAERVAAIVAMSRVVGMICPGLHSIFSGLSLSFVSGPSEPHLRYTVTEIDPRFQIVRIAVSGGGVKGELTTIARTPPVEQPRIDEIASRVPHNAYAGATVLVVGGSRGLGEVTAKACAAGGAHVLITYAAGQVEAEKIAEEIRRFGGACNTVNFDVRGDISAQLADLPAPVSHLYYFATRAIAQRRTRFLSDDLLSDFTRFYVTGFLETCETLTTRSPNRPLRAFYPSSVAVEDTPKGWVEYAMAKAAGEILCREMNLNLPDLDVVCKRLPRILTDQTASVRAIESAPILDVILPILREVQTPAP